MKKREAEEKQVALEKSWNKYIPLGKNNTSEGETTNIGKSSEGV
jgi:hypothetical protein